MSPLHDVYDFRFKNYRGASETMVQAERNRNSSWLALMGLHETRTIVYDW